MAMLCKRFHNGVRWGDTIS